MSKISWGGVGLGGMVVWVEWGKVECLFVGVGGGGGGCWSI